MLRKAFELREGKWQYTGENYTWKNFLFCFPLQATVSYL